MLDKFLQLVNFFGAKISQFGKQKKGTRNKYKGFFEKTLTQCHQNIAWIHNLKNFLSNM